MPIPDGGVADTFKKLSLLGTSHFQNLYKSPQGTNLVDILQVVGFFHRFVDEEVAEEINSPVTPAKLEGTLKWF